MTFGSLFTGIGGIDLGLERAGMECRWQIEVDHYCRQILAQHWPEVKRYDDIRTVTGDELESVDLICGGFPCQDLSQAGKRAGIQGPRSGLWFEFARLVGRLRPRWVLIENVPGLLVHDAMRRVIGELARCGYVGCWRSLRASEFGASHLRKRVFIVAHRSGERRQQDTGSALGNEAAHGREGRDLREPNSHYVTCRESADLADSPSRGFGNGLADGRGAELADAECAERRPNLEYLELSRGRIEATSGSGSNSAGLADSEHARCYRSEGPGIRTDGPPLQTARSGESDGCLEDTRRTGRWWPAQPAGLDQQGPSVHDCRTGGTLAHAEHEGPPCARTEDECGAETANGVRSGEQLADAGNGLLPDARREPERRDGSGSASPVFPDAGGAGLPDPEQAGLPEPRRRIEGRTVTELCGTFAPGPADPRWPDILRERPDLAPALANPGRSGSSGRRSEKERLQSGTGRQPWGEPASPDEPGSEEAQSPLRGVADGLPDFLDRVMRHRTKRLGRLGNAVVPDCAEWIGLRILEFEGRVE